MASKQYGMGVLIEETGALFETMTDCAEYLGVTVGSVSMCISGKIKTCAGYHIKLVDCVFRHRLDEYILDDLFLMTGEDCEWREHPTRNDVYVSDTGLVAKYQHGRVYIKNQHMINSGYLVTSVGDLGTMASKNTNVLVHRLVAETFVYNNDPDNKTHVNHIDGDKTNNCANNLEWCTRSQNMKHAFDNGLLRTECVVIAETGEKFRSAAECARNIGGTSSGLHDCKSGRQKAHKGYHFIFEGDDGYAKYN